MGLSFSVVVCDFQRRRTDRLYWLGDVGNEVGGRGGDKEVLLRDGERDRRILAKELVDNQSRRNRHHKDWLKIK